MKNEQEEQIIRYRDLSTPLQITIVLMWILLGIMTVSFMYGLILGITEAV